MPLVSWSWKADRHETSTMLSNKNRVSSFRRYLPQALACFAKNMFLLNFSLATNLPTIIIPALTGLNPANNPDEQLKITPEQQSWIASIFALFVVFGCLMTGFLDPLGRKMSIILCNIPFIFGWIYLYYSDSVWDIYVTLAVLGFFSGLSEAPVLNYIGELAEPSIRGILASSTGLVFEFGAALDYFLGNQMPWRHAVLIYTVVPIAAIAIMLFVPETPQWLLSHNRKTDALKSLQWLRGWVQPDDVQIEFEDLQRYRAIAYACYECEKKGTECNHLQPKITERLRELLRRKTWFPCVLVIILGFNSLIGGMLFRPYFVPILFQYKSPIDPNKVLAWLGYVGIIANILIMIIVRSIGKRRINLISFFFAIIILYALGAYGFLYLSTDNGSILPYFPVFGFSTIFFLSCLGLRTIPNLLTSEIFPYRSKSLAAGFTMAVYYVESSVSSKTFNSLQAAITLPGQCIFYASVGVLGFAIIYLILPETEGRTLEDIEMYFSDKKRKFNDIHIPSISENQNNVTNH